MSQKLWAILGGISLGGLLLLAGCSSPTSGGGIPLQSTGVSQPPAVSGWAMTAHDAEDHASWYRWNQPSYDMPETRVDLAKN
jgi:hypothetical protein